MRHNGEKYQSPYGWGKAIRTHELEAAINCCLGPKDFAMAKIMLFLTGNAEGFRVSEKTIIERCNISESGYKKARKKLVNKNWIFHEAGSYIQVNFNKIFSDYRAIHAGFPEDAPPEKVGTKAFSKSDEDSSGQSAEITQNENGIPEKTYNNIINNIRDNKNNIRDNSIESRCEDTSSEVANATSPSVSSQPLRETVVDADYWSRKSDAERKFKNWYELNVSAFESIFDLDNEEEYKTMIESEEYQLLLKEAEERREAIRKEFGYCND